VVDVAHKLSMIEEDKRQEQSCLFQAADYRNKGHNPNKLTWVRILMKIVSVAQKLGTTEEWRQDESFFFWRGNYRSKGHNPINLS
jgi:hypothetical protein